MPTTKTKKKPTKQGLSRFKKQITQESDQISLVMDRPKWHPSRKISFILGFVSGVAFMSILVFIVLAFIFPRGGDLPEFNQNVSGTREGYWIPMLEDPNKEIWVPHLPSGD